MRHYKLYHYSPQSDIDFIDPKYYGTGVTLGTECKRAKTGLNKSYYYTSDEPESCVKSKAHRYEIYLPYDWKELIYDRGTDPNKLYERVSTELFKTKQRKPYLYEVTEAIEQLIYDLGYKGWTNSASALPHAIVVFYKLSTKKPESSITYHWSGELIKEDTKYKDSYATSYHSFHVVNKGVNSTHFVMEDEKKMELLPIDITLSPRSDLC